MEEAVNNLLANESSCVPIKLFRKRGGGQDWLASPWPRLGVGREGELSSGSVGRKGLRSLPTMRALCIFNQENLTW